MEQRKVGWEEARQIMLKGGWCRREIWGAYIYAWYSAESGCYLWYPFIIRENPKVLSLKEVYFTSTWVVVKEPPEPVPSVEERLENPAEGSYEHLISILSIQLQKAFEEIERLREIERQHQSLKEEVRNLRGWNEHLIN